ncbi:MAG: hypothetical protein GXO07_02740 [Crenarchaeota archaeon]|nr:hypothetical protein [Thermoproteota archaeon]
MRVAVVCNPMNPWDAALAVNAALFLSNAIRKDTVVYVNVEGTVIVIDGSRARRVYPDSESLVGLFRAIKKGKRVPGVRIGQCPSCKPWCPGEEPGEEPCLDPSACPFPGPYTVDHKLAVLQIELDRTTARRACNKSSSRPPSK